MYCIKCGTELSEGQTVCPCCTTAVYHPDLPIKSDPTYPQKEFSSEEFNPRGVLFVITVLAFLVLALPVMFEWIWHGELNWSGYVSGGVLLFYIIAVLPFWFRSPNPVVFAPCNFAAVICYLLYVDLQGGDHWFLSFAFPITGALAVIVTAVIALVRYVRRGRLYIFGGGLIALGAWTVLMEFLIRLTFDTHYAVFWSVFTFVTFFVLGMMLIIIAIVRPLRESLRKIFFIG